jgi:carbonic anhydrase
MFTNIPFKLKLIAGIIVVLALWGASVSASPEHSATKSPAPAVSHGGPTVTPAQAVSQLKEGNVRFVSDKSAFPRQGPARLSETAPAQRPIATVLTCSDSRIPVEKIFDQGIGDLFVTRVAGNVCDVDETGTIEYGVDYLGTPILLVLGHTKCGAVTAVATKAEVEGSIPQLVDNIGPAVERAHKSNPSLESKDLVPAATIENVWQSIEDLIHRSAIVREKIVEGALKVYGGLYHLEDGTVEWLGPHPRQTALLVSPQSPVETARTAHEQESRGSLPDVSHVEAPDGITPTQALDWLKDGNKRFTGQKQIFPNQNAKYRADLVAAQHPFATVLTCSDSRLPVEEIYDVGAGDVFVVRVAGNVADVDEIGSIEYGTGHLGTPLLLVLGHTACGAVTAVTTGAELPGSIPALVDNIKPAVEKAANDNPSLSGKELVPAAIKANVWNAIDDLYAGSPLVCALVKSGKLVVQGAIYHLDNGTVEWLGQHPNQAQLVSGRMPSEKQDKKPVERFAQSSAVSFPVQAEPVAPVSQTVPAEEHPAATPSAKNSGPSNEVRSDKLEAAMSALEATVKTVTATPTSSAGNSSGSSHASDKAVTKNDSRISDTDLASIMAEIAYLKSELAQLKGQTAEAAKTLASLEDVSAAPVGSAPQLDKLANLVTTLNQSIEQQKAATKPAVNATTVGHGTIQFNGFVHQQYYGRFGTSKNSTFDSKRARLGIGGDVNSYARLDFVGEFAKTPKLLDGALSLSPNKNWTVKMGQYKVPFSADLLRSATAWPFVNLSLASALGPDRDIGMSVRYGAKFSKSSGIDLYTGVFNGSSINTSDANTNKNLALRAVAKIGTQFTIAPNWYFGKTNDTGSLRQKLSTYGGSIAWAAKHDVIEAEYIGSTIGTGRKEGWYVFGGHTVVTGSKFLQEIQFAARYEQMNPSVAAIGDKTNRLTLGANLFIDKKYTLIQLNYQINGEQVTSVKNDEFLMNFQVAF